MEPFKLSSSYIIRVYKNKTKERILVQDPRSNECCEFSSWRECLRYLQARSGARGLR